MTALLEVPTIQGHQRPRVCSLPPSTSTALGSDAVELAALAGLQLDPWEAFVLEQSLAEVRPNKWAAWEVGLLVPRQNGKGSILEARELAGLFLLGEQMIIHSAHQFDTSLEAFRRLVGLVMDTPDFRREVARIVRGHGEEGIELKSGQRIRFRTRTKGGGRGFTGDCVILDEAMDLPEATVAALMPTLAARSQQGNPQLWYTGSAVDQETQQNGHVLARVRRRGLTESDESLAFFEWSVDEDVYNADPEAVAKDINSHMQSNPGQGIRISSEHINRERLSMAPKTFAVERLGVGDWPDPDGINNVFDPALWPSLVDSGSGVASKVCFAVDVQMDRSSAAICMAGIRPDGLFHGELVYATKGTDWVVPRLVELAAKWRPIAVVVDSVGPASGFIADLQRESRFPLVIAKTGDVGRASGAFFDLVTERRIRHIDQPLLNRSIQAARKRPLADSFAWARKDTVSDISPLVALTLALWGLDNPAQRRSGVVW